MLRLNDNAVTAPDSPALLPVVWPAATRIRTPACRAQARAIPAKGRVQCRRDRAQECLDAHAGRRRGALLAGRVYLDIGDGVSAEKEIRLALKLGHPPRAACRCSARRCCCRASSRKCSTKPRGGGQQRRRPAVRACRCLPGLGKRDLAKQLYDKVLQAQPKFAAGADRPWARGLPGARCGGGAQYADQALAAEPRNTDALLFKGDLLRAQNQPAQALAAYDKVLAINPAHRSAHIEKAYLEIAIGKFDAAQADLDAARKIAPGQRAGGLHPDLAGLLARQECGGPGVDAEGAARGARTHAQRAAGRRDQPEPRLAAPGRAPPAALPGKESGQPVRAQDAGVHAAAQRPYARCADGARAGPEDEPAGCAIAGTGRRIVHAGARFQPGRRIFRQGQRAGAEGGRPAHLARVEQAGQGRAGAGGQRPASGHQARRQVAASRHRAGPHRTGPGAFRQCVCGGAGA